MDTVFHGMEQDGLLLDIVLQLEDLFYGAQMVAIGFQQIQVDSTILHIMRVVESHGMDNNSSRLAAEIQVQKAFSTAQMV